MTKDKIIPVTFGELLRVFIGCAVVFVVLLFIVAEKPKNKAAVEALPDAIKKEQPTTDIE